MRTAKSGTLVEFEAVLAAALYEHPATACFAVNCPNRAVAAAQLAERVADAVAYEWGGQSVYFKIRDAVYLTQSELSENSEEFLMELEKFIAEELSDGASMVHCTECLATHNSWGEVVACMVAAVYSAFQGQTVYIPFDVRRRNKLILRDFTGSNVGRLARKYKLSSATIYGILGKARQAKKGSSGKRSLSPSPHAASSSDMRHKRIISHNFAAKQGERSMSESTRQLREQATAYELASNTLRQVTAAYHALEQLVEMGYVSGECAAKAWMQYVENTNLIKQLSLAPYAS